jgi:hypothetical protein
MQGASYLSSNGFESRILGPRRDITHGEDIGSCVNLLFKLRKMHGLMCDLAFLIRTVFLSLAVVICNA